MDLNYIFNDAKDGLIVKGSRELAGELIIPSEHELAGKIYPVKEIGDEAFSWTKLTSVIIPDSVIKIGVLAFGICNKLNSIVIPNSVITIEDRAFLSCTELTSIHIPASVTFIHPWAFVNCDKITNIIVDKENKQYDSRDNCNAIIETKTNTLVIGGNSSFIPDSVLKIGKDAFRGRSNLSSIIIPDSVTEIDDGAFYDCVSIKSVIISKSAVRIGDHAFRGCAISSVLIPDSVNRIERCPFSGCSKLVSIVVEKNNNKYDSRDDCNAIIETATNILVVGCSTSTIPKSIVEIGSNAFLECENLSSITMPDSVTKIGSWAFMWCSDLESIDISCNVTEIGTGAFLGCKRLKSITIPNNVILFKKSVLEDCPMLISIKVDKGNLYYDSRDDCNAIIETASNTLIAGCSSTIIPDSVTKIGEMAFCGCYREKGGVMRDEVKGRWRIRRLLGKEEQQRPSSTTLIIPDSVTSIGRGAFMGCYGLQKIVIRDASLLKDACVPEEVSIIKPL